MRKILICFAMLIVSVLFAFPALQVKAEGEEPNFLDYREVEIGRWEWCDFQGNVLSNPASQITAKTCLSIYGSIEDAISQIQKGGEKITVARLTLYCDPKTDNYVLSDIFSVTEISLWSGKSNTNRYIYNENVEAISISGGYLTVNGRVDRLVAGSQSAADATRGNLIINGDVDSIIAYYLTEADGELTDKYTAEARERSVEASKATDYCKADITIKGKVRFGNFINVYYHDGLNNNLFITKALAKNIEINGPIIVNGALSSDLLALPGLEKYSTEKWYNDNVGSMRYAYAVSYENTNGYRWERNICDANGGVLQVETFTDLNASTHLPNDLGESAWFVIASTDDTGFVFEENMIPKEVDIRGGKVTINQNLDGLHVNDLSKYSNGAKIYDVTINGNVADIRLTHIATSTNLTVSGNIAEGTLFSLDSNGALQSAEFTKEVDKYNELVKDGTINKELTLKSPGGLNYNQSTSTQELEEAVGIDNDKDAITKEDGTVLYKEVSSVIDVSNLNDDQKTKIETEVDTTEYVVSDKAIDIEISTHYRNGEQVEKNEVVSETTNPVKYSVQIPDYEEGAEYDLVRIHKNADESVSYDILPVTVDGGKANFSSDKFSSFVFVKKQNGGNSPTPDPQSPVTDFCARMYTVALSRGYDAEGLNYWSSQLVNREINGAGIARGFILSKEFTDRNLTNEEYVTVLYRTFFDREPDEGGKAGWLAELNSGKSREFILAGFVNSAEFDNLAARFGIIRGYLYEDGRAAENGIYRFVERMYTKALNRASEKAGFDDWSNRIITGQMSPVDVAKSFVFSDEFINRNLSNSDYVETLYQTFMDRASDAGGKADWVGKLDHEEMNREQVLYSFAGSQEFIGILNSFNLG